MAHDETELAALKASARESYLRITAPEESLKFWNTLDGRRLRICELDDVHLKNCIRHTSRTGRINTMDLLQREQARRQRCLP